MEFIGTIKSVSAVRKINGRTGELKMVDVVISNGIDTVVATAFDQMAGTFESETIKPEMLCVCHLMANVNEKDGRVFQSLRLSACAMIVDPNKAF